MFTNVGKTAEQIETTTLKCPHCVWKTHDTERYRAEIELSEHVEFHHKEQEIEEESLPSSSSGRKEQGLSKYAQLREVNIKKNDEFLVSLGFESVKLCTSSNPKTKHNPKRAAPEVSDKERKKSLRITSILAPVLGQQEEENVQLPCPICQVKSYPVPYLQAQAWILDHQRTSSACLRIQQGLAFIDPTIKARKLK